MRFSSAVMGAALSIDPAGVADRWAPVFGLPRVGSGQRLSWSLGQVVMARGMRGFTGQSNNPFTAVVVERFCRQGPALIDGPGPRPRFVAMIRGRVVAVHDELELVRELQAGAPVIHYVDVDLALAELDLSRASAA